MTDSNSNTHAAQYRHEIVGVFGYPVDENPTIVMHEAAFAERGLLWRYQNFEVQPEALPDAIKGMRAMGFKGINLTIPHKVAVIPLLDAVADDAAMIGAVNTVRRDGERLIGENTDGKGFLRGVREDAGIDPQGKQVVVLGAGGAARAIIVELMLAGAADILVRNRSEARGKAMVAEVRQRISPHSGGSLRFDPWTSTHQVTDEVNILVNATSIGLYPDVDAMPDVSLDGARSDLLVCDVIPNPPETPLVKAAAVRGLRVLNGLSMLVYQGAIGFEMWTGQPAPEATMKTALAKAFGG